VLDAANCTSATMVTLTSPGAPTLVATNQTNPGCGQNTGSVTLSASGGAPPYQYSINGGAYQNGAVFGSLGAGTYSFSVRDGANCVSETQVTLTNPGAPVLLVTNQTNPGCGQNTGSVTLSASGGAPPYQYSINGGAYQNGAFFGNLGAGTYSFLVRDAANCTTALSVDLTDNSAALPAAAIIASDTRGCSETIFQLTANLPAGTTGVWSCSGCNIASPTQPQLALSGLPPGNTVVNWTLSAPDCPNYSKSTVTITVFAPPQANGDGIFQVTAPDDFLVPFLANDVANAPVFTEIIRPPKKGTVNLGTNNQLLYQPALQVEGLDTLIYSLCYEECPQVCDSAMVIFQILSESDPCFITGDTTNLFTNGLTPNNDGMNDKLVFRIVDKAECEVNHLSSDLIVYNRWGDVVYKSDKPYNNDWGGTTRDNSPLPPGVYYFVLRVADRYSQFGNVIIIR
jgi:gliding motility-associated-like protein